jgi:inner membrane protein
MSSSEIALYWIIAGILLSLAEFLVPGGIMLFIGLGALIVGLLAYLGIVEGWLPMLFVWFAVSISMILGLRGAAQKLVRAKVQRGQTDEDIDAYSRIAEVRETIPAGGEGRIAFQGTTWAARNVHGDRDLPPGTRVRIVFRENLAWMVEACDETESADTGGSPP